MAIQIEACPSCGAPIELAGKRTKCPYCSTSITITEDNPQTESGQQKVVPIQRGYNTSLAQLLFSFSGRIRRRQYWLGFGFVCLAVYLSALFVKTFIGDTPTTGDDSPPSIANGIASLLYLATLWIFVAVHRKRFHDRGKSGWWTAVWLLPFGFLWVFYEAGIRK